MTAELLAPAGTLEKLKWAVAYGAQAVYFGVEFGSLRSFAGNLSYEQAQIGLDYLHARGCKGYVALNIYPFSHEYKAMREIARTLDDMGADAFIVADLGVLRALRDLDLKADLHISTQANTTSWQAVEAYRELGAKRVNLARELSLAQIQEIQQRLDDRIETEVFIHGAVCFSYSGRCAISDYLTGFRANHGQCKHPCRWKYALMEEKRPGQFFPVYEDERGLYFFNDKDLALFSYVPALADAGVASFKIEGRMKSIHYIASTVSFYRQVLDGRAFSAEQGLERLGRVPNRGYSEGFMKGSITPDDYSSGQSKSQATSVFVGNALGKTQDGFTIIEVRNKIYAGDELEVLLPNGMLARVQMPDPLITQDKQEAAYANNSEFLLIEPDLPEYSVLRRLSQEDAGGLEPLTN